MGADILRGHLAARLEIHDPSQVGHARRLARRMAGAPPFTEVRAEEVAIVVTELASNLLRHGGGGELLLQLREGPAGVEVVALDRGPGLDRERALRDGVSTTGTSGTGLGAVTRLATAFDLHSQPGIGTAVLARLLPRNAPAPAASLAFEVGGILVAKPGQEVSGDAWAVAQHGPTLSAIVCDGLGSGPAAAAAAEVALQTFGEQAARRAPVEVIGALDRTLRRTRGAAVTVVQLDAAARTVRHSGIGNVAAACRNAETAQHLVPDHGVCGRGERRPRGATQGWTPDTVLIMHSDGLTQRWDLAGYRDLVGCDPTLTAAVLYRDHGRGRDDAAVLVVRPIEGT